MAKHFKPPKETPFNTPENTRWFAFNRKTPNPSELFESISPDNLPDGYYGFSVDGDLLEINVLDLFYKGVERVYVFDKDHLRYNVDEEF